MDCEQFCEKLVALKLSHPEIAVRLLWYFDDQSPGAQVTPGYLARLMTNVGLGNPHSTKLREALKRTGMVNETPNGLQLKHLARCQLRESLKDLIGPQPAQIDLEFGYLPQKVWSDTRGYIERVCVQINGSYQFGLYDGASVLVRRLIETLIIEAYEHQGRITEIRSGEGTMLMLRDLVARANGSPGLSIGRDSRRALSDVKDLGDRSAHNRKFNAVKADLDQIRSGVRVCVDELINIADLRRGPTHASGDAA